MNTDNQSSTEKNEEIDLLMLFRYFESLFSKFIGFITTIFLNLFRAIIYIITIAFKKIGVLLAVSIVTFLSIKSLKHIQSKVYVSNMLVKQNYSLGNLLYDDIERFDKLAKNERYVALANELKLPSEKASTLKKFEIKSGINKAKLLEFYNSYSKTVDSVTKMPFSKFEEIYNYKDYPLQIITVFSKDESIFKLIEKPLVENIISNKFFQKEKEKELGILKSQISAFETTLNESKKLQDKYIEFLEKYYNGIGKSESQSDFNLNINEGSAKKNTELTKEYELFSNNNEIKLKIAELKNSMIKKEDVFVVQRGFSSATIDEKIYSEYKIEIIISVALLTLLVFLYKDMNAKGILKKLKV